ncbi:MAG: 50S ribosomal protein L4 [Bacteroidales bacterium]|jgi:large subunit ribosomal protein L4|nr:50S ribosomal protein L4 [Bacteroidales bacterium]
MELTVYKFSGEDTGRKVILNEEVFGVEPNDHAIWLDVKQFQANQRQGTHKSKDRSEMSGSTRKLKKQKGTGGARAGDINSPVFVGGGRAFGPRPRDYSFKLNKKVKRLARKSALSYKVIEQQITVLEDFNFEKPRTKDFIEILKKFELEGKRTLLVLDKMDRWISLSARNIQRAQVVDALSLNTHDILHAKYLILTEGALSQIDQMYNSAE